MGLMCFWNFAGACHTDSRRKKTNFILLIYFLLCISLLHTFSACLLTEFLCLLAFFFSIHWKYFCLFVCFALFPNCFSFLLSLSHSPLLSLSLSPISAPNSSWFSCLSLIFDYLSQFILYFWKKFSFAWLVEHILTKIFQPHWQ